MLMLVMFSSFNQNLNVSTDISKIPQHKISWKYNVTHRPIARQRLGKHARITRAANNTG
jgi:hypothetical protein